jgi:hypothetical protein
MSVYIYTELDDEPWRQGGCVCVCVCSKLGTINECIYIYTGLDDEPWRQGGGDVEAAEDADKKGVAWLKRARSGSKAAAALLRTGSKAAAARKE